MVIHLVENEQGRRKVRPVGVVLLLGACLLACMAIPTAAFWLSLGDKRLVAITLAVGFSIACSSFGAILGKSLRLPIEKLPPCVSNVDA